MKCVCMTLPKGRVRLLRRRSAPVSQRVYAQDMAIWGNDWYGGQEEKNKIPQAEIFPEVKFLVPRF